jgi:hypothetical protein
MHDAEMIAQELSALGHRVDNVEGRLRIAYGAR